MTTASHMQAESSPNLTAIDRYVQAPDDSYKWEVHSVIEGDGIRHVIIDLTSQNWLTTDDVNRTEWKHWLGLTIPDGVTAETALLFISGGNNNNTEPSPNDLTAQIAKVSQTIVAELGMIPNQPLVYKSDPLQRERYEDDLIGYAWDQYIQSDDPRWLPRGPMVKGAVRAMDAITEYTSSEDSDVPPVSKFVVAGGSKRGWTAWLTAAMDPRVVAVAPIVIDVVNIRASMEHHFKAYGFWAPSIGNYVEHGLMERWENPKIDEIYALVDPYSYLDRIKMPKLVLNASGDQFFLPDSSQFYWDDLKGPKYLRYVPNANHSLNDSNGIETLATFHAMIVNNHEIPKLSWSINAEGALEVTPSTQPVDVQLWHATNSIARDFRVETIGRVYRSTALEPTESGAYVASVDPPVKGWTAYFVEMTWDVGLPVPFRLSTEVIVTPDTLPYADKDPGLPNSVTLMCQAQSEETREALASTINALEDTSFAKEGIKMKTWGNRLYINWTPAKLFQSGFFEMADLLEKSGCSERSYQFESGPDITVPPIPPAGC